MRKQRGFKIVIADDVVSVEHRASYTRPGAIVWSLLGFAYWCWYSYSAGPIADFLAQPSFGIGVLAAVSVLVPLFAAATWVMFSSGEVLRCTPQELHFAHRSTWRRWKRFRYTPAEVQKLQRIFRMLHKDESYWTLTFQHNGKSVDMLQQIPVRQADDILQACKGMGWDTILIPNPGAAMDRDIEQRGWFVNPWRKDKLTGSQKDD